MSSTVRSGRGTRVVVAPPRTPASGLTEEPVDRLPAPTLPKGGTAVHGLGETFEVDAHTGGWTLRVPLALAAPRGVAPDLALVAGPGGGPSAFGHGWDLPVASVSRRPGRGVPTYTDADTFSHGDDLVPLLVRDASGDLVPWEADEPIDGAHHRVRRFVPRTEGQHLRIEQCRADDGAVFWRTRDRDNVTRTYGRSAASRVHDPADPTGVHRVAQWLLDEVRDDRGNVTVYEYAAEDTAGVPPSPYEAGRLAAGAPAPAARHLKRVRYGNAVPGDAATCRIQVVLDYGEHDLAAAPARPWPARPDPVSSHRTGFEVRSWRLCRRIMVFHDFGADAGPGPLPRLVRTLELSHDSSPSRTLLTGLREVGYDFVAGAYVSAATAPMTFAYTAATPASGAHAGDLAAVPDGAQVHWVDLDGDGLPGALYAATGCWWYQAPAGEGRWHPPRRVPDLPPPGRVPGAAALGDADGSGRLLATGGVPPLDAGTGSPLAVLPGSAVLEGAGAGARWQPWRTASQRAVDLPAALANWRSVDATGDGRADALSCGPDALRWRESLGRDGWGPARTVPTGSATGAPAPPEGDAPRPPGDDRTGGWLLADMTGDGLADLVHVGNGLVEYWPAAGHGRLGARVRMAGAPVLDHPDQLDLRRLRVVDLDGTGTADLLYLGRNEVVAWPNWAGNSFGPPTRLTGCPPVRRLDDVSVQDLLGRGTACLVWTTSTPGADGVAVRWLDLTGADGPALRLRSYANGLGATTTIRYTSAAAHRLADATAGVRWRTRLPSALPVVAATTVLDAVARSSSTSTYRYREAWFDPAERELRGFARVEVVDADDPPPPPPGLPDPRQPATRTVTWFHTGAPGLPPAGTFAGDAAAPPAGPTDLVSGGVLGAAAALDGQQWREAHRAAAGRPRRVEIHAAGSAAGAAPYTVTEHRMRVRALQPPTPRHPGVYRVEPLEVLDRHYETVAADPRVTHVLTLGVDEYGTATSVASLAYRRRTPLVPEQARTLCSWTRTEVANVDTAGALRLGAVTRQRTYEVTNVPVPPGGAVDPDALDALLPALPVLAVEQSPDPVVPQARLVEESRCEYWDGTAGAALPAGQCGPLAVLRRTWRLAFTPGLLTAVHGGDVDAALLAEGGYEPIDGSWWAGDGVLHPDPAAFWLPVRWDVPLGGTATATYDAHRAAVVATRAATAAPLDLVRADITPEYRMLGPRRIVDGNGVTREVALDPLGRVAAAWVRGPDGSGDPVGLPGELHTYASTDWADGVGPAWSQSRRVRRHGDPAAERHEQRLYVDGLGRVVLTKTRTGPGPALAPDGGGGAVEVDTTPEPRWIGSGRTVFGSKGQPVAQYEPYFSATPAYESDDAVVKHALAEVRTYDPLGRVTRVDLPDGTHERHETTAWGATAHDRNDTVLASDWFAQRQPATTPAEQARAAVLAAAHAGTATVSLTDPLGRVTRTRVDTGGGVLAETVLHLGPGGECLAVDDALGRRVEAQTHDALGRVVATTSIDAGDQRVFSACDGHAVRQWGPTGSVVHQSYDALRRPTGLRVSDDGGATWRLAQLTVHGEQHPDAVARGLVGRVHRRYDQAGLSRADRHDLDGNLTGGSRRLRADPAATTGGPVDWAPLARQPLAALDGLGAALLSTEDFTSAAAFDALGNLLTQTLPDGTVLDTAYDPGGALLRAGVTPAGGARTAVVTATVLDASSRRVEVAGGNGVVTRYAYDPCSRLSALSSHAGATALQDLRLTYDPAGNVVEIADLAAQPVFFAGAVVGSGRQYTYDAQYRLRTATGREHASLGVQPDARPPDLAPLPHPHDAAALRRWTEEYDYDAVGNLTRLAHSAAGADWTRRYDYTPGTNRLAAHSLPGDAPAGPFTATFDHDAGGRMTRMTHLDALGWDHAGRLVTADLGGGGTVAYHVDAQGGRVRQVWRRLGSMREERIRLGGYEVFRRYSGDVLVFERTTVAVGDGKRVAALVETVTVDTQLGAAAGPRLRYQLTDHLGSVTGETDSTGQVISYEEYHPFGTTALWLARGAAAAGARRYRYGGHELDDGTGLYGIGLRAYAPWLGRWTSPDPAGATDGVDRYVYVQNNPLRLVDRTGLQGAEAVDLFAKPPSPFAGAHWGAAAGEQLWLSEAKPFWAEARATAKGRGFGPAIYEYFRKVTAAWGGPEGYVLGHQTKPFAFLQPGEDSWIAVQSGASNAQQSVWEGALVKAARDGGVPVREPGGLFPGATAGARYGQPPLPTVGGITPTFPGGPVEPVQLPLPFGPQPPPAAGKPWVQLELDLAAKPPAGAPPAAADTGALAKAVPLADDAGALAKAAPVADDAGALAKVAPLADDAGALAKAAPSAGEAGAAATVATRTGAAAEVAPVAKDAALALGKDAEAVSTLAKGGEAVKSVAPIAKEAAPIAKEAGVLTKVLGTGSRVLKAAAPVVRVAKPVLHVVGEVAKPLAVLSATVDLATSNNNTDRLVATGDLAAGAAFYCGPVGVAGGTAYAVTGLLDQGIAAASKATVGVDLSPSNGLAVAWNAQDKVVSSVIPDDPNKPSYKNENKVAWFLIDTLGF